MIPYSSSQYSQPIVSGKSQPFSNLNNFISQWAPNKQAMIYGFNHCDYTKVIDWLRVCTKVGEFNDVFSYNLGQPRNIKKMVCGHLESDITSEKRKIKRINHDNRKAQPYKAGLVNLVIENYKRTLVDLPIIPIIFIVGKDNTQLDISLIFDKTNGPNHTGAEIKQAYKLCFDKGVKKKVRAVAKQTFIFLSLQTNDGQSSKFKFEKVLSPWLSADWEMLWKTRAQKPKDEIAQSHWRKEIIRLTT